MCVCVCICVSLCVCLSACLCACQALSLSLSVHVHDNLLPPPSQACEHCNRTDCTTALASPNTTATASVTLPGPDALRVEVGLYGIVALLELVHLAHVVGPYSVVGRCVLGRGVVGEGVDIVGSGGVG